MKTPFVPATLTVLVAASMLSVGGCASLDSAHIARIELHQFASKTLTDQERLSGSTDGKPVTIAGELRIPTLGKDKLPAVVLMQGGAGLVGFIDDWARELNSLGIATFMPDTNTGRGLDSILKLGRLAMIDDAYGSLQQLQKHPRIDPNRIVLMGFSASGNSTLGAAMKRFRRGQIANDSPGFAAYVAFYPTCHLLPSKREDVVDKPIRILHGSADDVAPIGACRDYVAALTKAGKDARVHEYAGATHVFDWVLQKEGRPVPNIVKFGKCRIAEGDGGRMMNLDTGKVLTPNDACAEKGSIYVYSADAHEAARNDLREFLAVILKLPQR